MFKSFKNSLLEIEKLYDAKDYNGTILQAAMLTEQVINIFFNNFHTQLTTKEDWKKYLEFEQSGGDKYLSFIKRPTIGVAIGYYNSLAELFPNHRGISPEIKQLLNTINTIRNAHLHSNQKNVSDDEAGRILDSLETLLTKADVLNVSTTVIGIPIKYYLVFTSIKEKFETSDTSADFKRIISDATKVIPPLLNAFLNKIFHTLNSERKAKLIDLFISSVDAKSENEIAYYNGLCKVIEVGSILPQGLSLMESLTAIGKSENEYSRRQCRHYVNVLEICIGNSHNPETIHFLHFADSVKKRFLQNQKITETDRIILNEKAQELKISNDLANTIEASVISTIERELIRYKTLSLNETALKAGSLLLGYDYDVAISFAGNQPGMEDWVMEFSDKLRRELAGIMKDKVTVYCNLMADSPADVNTYERTIRSLIFIPIISESYCEANSPAWNKEFLRFKEDAKQSEVGLSVARPGGAVSRIIPVIVHELQQSAKVLLETELKGSLRTVDFVWRDNGSVRPLTFLDDERAQAKSQVLYRNQINKVAIGIKEVIYALSEVKTVEPQASTSSEKSAVAIASNSPKIFLAWTSSDLKARRDEIAIMLERAGMVVLPSTDCPSEDEDFKAAVKQNIAKANYSLHLLSGEYGRRFERDDHLSYPQYQFLEGQKKSREEANNFQLFIWYVPSPGGEIKPAQQSFISEIRMNITAKMMFSNVAGAFQLVENILGAINKRKVEKIDTKEFELLFIYCEDDEFEASDVTSIIGKEYPLEILNILSSGGEDYKELSRQQVLKSKLAVVYFKYAADWAIPFIKQLWREVGGASSPTQMMLVGDDDPRTNRARRFKAPKVICEIIPKEVIPAEILTSYSNLSGTQ